MCCEKGRTARYLRMVILMLYELTLSTKLALWRGDEANIVVQQLALIPLEGSNPTQLTTHLWGDFSTIRYSHSMGIYRTAS